MPKVSLFATDANLVKPAATSLSKACPTGKSDGSASIFPVVCESDGLAKGTGRA
jgi:hypothetical protein